MGTRDPIHTVDDANAAPMRSSLAHDGRVSRVLDRFIANLPQRVAHLTRTLDQGDLQALRHALHNLKGAGAGYGFAALSDQSAHAEQALVGEKSPDDVRHEVDQLIALIRRIEGYDPAADATEPNLPPRPAI